MASAPKINTSIGSKKRRHVSPVKVASFTSICNLTIALEAAIIRAWREGDGIMGSSKNVDGRKLVVLSGRTKGTAFVLTKPQVNAGRENDNAICLKGKRVSRYHAVLVRNNGEYTLRDVSPRIGTLLNGRPTKEAPLKLGDRIRIGEFEMSYEAATAPAIRCTQNGVGASRSASATLGSPSATMPPQLDELTAPRIQIAAAQKESVEELAAENSAAEYQRRIAELTQETERLVGEVNLANEALESLRARWRTRSDLQPDSTERLTVSQENAALAKLNSELQAKISELEASAGKADRLETELAVAQAALRQMSKDLAKARKSTKLDAIAEQLGRALQLNPAECAEELERIQTALAETRGEWDKISDLYSQVEQFAVENHELLIALAKAREEAAIAKRCISDQTNEEFDRIRRSLVVKQNQKPDKLSRFLRPFRVTARTARIS